MAPLTAILSMTKGESVDDADFNWWTQTQSTVQGTVSGIFTVADLSVAYAGGGVAGDTLFISITTILANRIVKGKQILLSDASDYRVDVVGKVTEVTRGNTLSVLAVKMLEADNNSPTNDLTSCDNFKIIGNIVSRYAVPSCRSLSINSVSVYQAYCNAVDFEFRNVGIFFIAE